MPRFLRFPLYKPVDELLLELEREGVTCIWLHPQPVDGDELVAEVYGSTAFLRLPRWVPGEFVELLLAELRSRRNYFKGAVGAVRVYGRALSEDEVRGLYGDGA